MTSCFRGARQHLGYLLTLIQCVVTNCVAGTADDYRIALMARLAALSDVYAIIEGASRHRVSLRKLIEGALMSHSISPNNRVALAGPDITLEPHCALSLHLIFHELATHASKHGSLLCASGGVEVLWDTLCQAGNQALAVRWREHGGPLVRKPRQMRFGIRLTTNSLPGAQVNMDFASAGLVCRLLLELE